MTARTTDLRLNAEMVANDCNPRKYTDGAVQETADRRHFTLGTFVCFKGQRGREVRTDVRCPFCETWLSRFVDVPQVGRVVKECTGGPACDGVSALVPSTHLVLACRPCGLIFTTLKEAP